MPQLYPKPDLLQAMFDNVWEYFVVKKGPPGLKGTQCRFRGYYGPCAIGLFLPDDVANANISLADIKCEGTLEELFGSIDFMSLCELQRVHDRAITKAKSFHVAIERELGHFADDHNLTVQA